MGYWYSEDAGRWTLLGFAIFVLAGGLVGTYVHAEFGTDCTK